MKSQVLLTFDLEEFDLPLEFDCPITEEEQISTTNEGLTNVLQLLERHDIPATFFTTSFYANKSRELILNIPSRHEIASHSKYHSAFSESDPKESKTELENITGKVINGFRMPMYRKIDKRLLWNAGYIYDSSLNPTFIPGRYNKLTAPRKIHFDKSYSLIEIPVSVSPAIRFPLFWLSFKNLPYPFYKYMCRRVIRKDSYLHLYFHPWEFAGLDRFRIPGYIKKISGISLTERLERLIIDLQPDCEFSTISGYLKKSGMI